MVQPTGNVQQAFKHSTNKKLITLHNATGRCFQIKPVKLVTNFCVVPLWLIISALSILVAKYWKKEIWKMQWSTSGCPLDKTGCRNCKRQYKPSGLLFSSFPSSAEGWGHAITNTKGRNSGNKEWRPWVEGVITIINKGSQEQWFRITCADLRGRFW